MGTEEYEIKLEYGNDNEDGNGGKVEKQNNDTDEETIISIDGGMETITDFPSGKDEHITGKEKETITMEMRLSGADKYMDQCPASAPRSTIINTPRLGMTDAAIYRVIAHALWEKYIREGANLEINIPYSDRKFYRECAAENWMYGPEKMFGIFDLALEKITILLKYAFTRYHGGLNEIRQRQEQEKGEKKR